MPPTSCWPRKTYLVVSLEDAVLSLDQISSLLGPGFFDSFSKKAIAFMLRENIQPYGFAKLVTLDVSCFSR